MKQDHQQLLKPEIIKTVSGLALVARVIVDGYLNGVNTSRRVGSGMEFSQYRSYEPGDDLRLLDWKMLARSGRYYIKQSEIETNSGTLSSFRLCRPILPSSKRTTSICFNWASAGLPWCR